VNKTRLLLLLAPLALASCETWDVDKYDYKQQSKYPIPPDANQACKDAAAKARHWCRDTNVPTDTTWSQECQKAQWVYNENCR
jgi:hypothetical protein